MINCWLTRVLGLEGLASSEEDRVKLSPRFCNRKGYLKVMCICNDYWFFFGPKHFKIQVKVSEPQKALVKNSSGI